MVGGGILGTALATRLGEADLEVTLYDRGALGEGATAASMAVFAWQSLHPTDFEYRLCRDSWAEYERVIEAGNVGFTPTGTLDLASTAEGRETIAEAAKKLCELGVDARALTPEEVKRFGIAPEGVTGGLYTDREYSTGEAFASAVAELLATSVPKLAGADLEAGWVGIRTVSPDGLPLVGEVGEAGLEGFLVACGPSGLGVTRAPAIADLLGTYLETGRASEDLEALSPTRFDETER